jgi:hypothetical protein
MFNYDKPKVSVAKILRTYCKAVGKIPVFDEVFNSKKDYKNMHIRYDLDAYYLNNVYIKRMYNYKNKERYIAENYNYFSANERDILSVNVSLDFDYSTNIVTSCWIEVIFKVQKNENFPAKIQIKTKPKFGRLFDKGLVNISDIKTADIKELDVVFGYFTDDFIQSKVIEFQPEFDIGTSTKGVWFAHNIYGYAKLNLRPGYTHKEYMLEGITMGAGNWGISTSKERKLRKLLEL